MRRRSTDLHGRPSRARAATALALALLGGLAAAQVGAAETLRSGQPLSGEVTDADAVITTPALEAGYTRAPTVGRRFVIEADEPGTWRVELRSHAFDAYLVLRGADGAVRAEDDDGLLATHAQVVFEVGGGAGGAVDGGALTVEACALHGGRGAFEIVLAQGTPPKLDPRAKIEAEIDDLRQSIAVRERTLGSDDPQLANPLNELALRLKALGDFAAARPLYERSLALFEQGNGPDSIEVAVVSNNLGGVLLNLGDLEGARAAAERAVGTIEKLAGPDDPVVAAYLGLYAEVLRTQGDFEAAGPVYERALELAEKGRGPVHPDVCQALSNLALFKLQRGDAAAAVLLLERAVDVAEQVAGPDHVYVSTPLANLGSALLAQGEFARSRQHLERALALLERQVGPDSVQLIELLNSLAMLDEAVGDYGRARATKERIVALAERALGPDSPDLAMALNNLGATLSLQGEFAAALPLYERSLAIREAALGPTHSDVAQSLHQLASTSEHLGDSAGARSRYERSLALWEKALSPDHPLVAQSLNNLALILLDSPAPGDRDEARRMLERSLAIREKALGARHPAVAESLGNLGAFHLKQRDFAAARPYVERALAIEEQIGGPGVASHLHNLGGLAFEAGDLDGASVHFGRSLAIREELLGPGHPLLVLSQLNLAELELDRGEVGAAVALLERAESGRAEHLARIMAGASEAEASAFTASIRTHIELGQSAVVRQARPVASAESLLAWKGQVLRAARQGRAALRDSLGDEGRALAERIEQVSAALSNAATALSEGVAPAGAGQLDGLIGERQRLERELAPLAARALPEPPRWQDVRDALPERALLVDLVVHKEYQPLAQGAAGGSAAAEAPRGVWGPPRVTAWVTRRDSREPLAVDLGPVAALEAAVRDARSLVERARGGSIGESKRRGAALEPLVLEPLRPHLEGIETVFVSPDGVLATVPFETLRDADGRYLVESRGFVYLTDPTELVRMEDRSAAAAPTLLALGGVDFGAEAGSAAVNAANAGGAATARSSTGAPDLRGAMPAPWSPLAATRAEIDSALAVHAAAFAQAERRALAGADATEAALVAALPRHSVLHLATHGFFQPERMLSLEAAARRDVEAGLERRSSAERLDDAALRDAVQRLQGYSPGLLSGLVCAGANAERRGDGDDGYLTAEEVGWLDLSGCDLVVLSACDTGLGRPQAGEGLMGLRRAFLTAGARTVISSLWAVPDQETAELMGRFYENLWQRKMGAHAALRAAQLELIARNRERFGGDARPVTWGAFVLEGEWR